MKITEIETLRLGEFPNLLWVRVHTDEGITGVGEAACDPSLDQDAVVVDDVAGRLGVAEAADFVAGRLIDADRQEEGLVPREQIVGLHIRPRGAGVDGQHACAASDGREPGLRQRCHRPRKVSLLMAGTVERAGQAARPPTLGRGKRGPSTGLAVPGGARRPRSP